MRNTDYMSGSTQFPLARSNLVGDFGGTLTTLRILSGGAAEGLVSCTAPAFHALTGFSITGKFGAVGEMATYVRKGDPVDVLILTRALILELVAAGLTSAEAAKDIGAVLTSVAIRKGDAAPSVADPDELRTAILAAPAFFTPNIENSTAGRHVAWMLKEMGIWQDAKEKLQIFPNGAKAMAAMANSDIAGAIGCTQATEILNTSGVTRVADLPNGLSLSTVYTAAVATVSTHIGPAAQLIDMLSRSTERTRLGFVS